MEKGRGSKAGESVEALSHSLAHASLGERQDTVTVLYTFNGRDMSRLTTAVAKSEWWDFVEFLIGRQEQNPTAARPWTLFVGKVRAGGGLERGEELQPQEAVELSLDKGHGWPPGEVCVWVESQRRPPVDLSLISRQQLRSMENAVVKEYMAIGEILKDTREARQIFAVLRRVADHQGNPKSFVVIDISSGTGKSQVVCYVSLDESWCVVYLVLGTLGESSPQGFYAPFAETSALFRAALSRDLEGRNDQEDSLSVTRLQFSRQSFWSLAVVAKIAGFSNVTSALTVAAFKERAPSNRNMAVFLDEVQDTGPRELRLARNLLRAAGVVVVLLGTNTNAINLVGKAAQVSRGDDDDVWARVIVQLPPTVVRAIPESKRLPWLTPPRRGSLHPAQQFMASAVQTARPWFAHLLCRVLLKNDLANQNPAEWIMGVFDTAVQLVAARKSRVWETNQLDLVLGQYVLFQKQLLRDMASASQSSLLKTHFARLAFAEADVRDGAVAFHLFLSSVALMGKNKVWTASTTFPRPSDEPALFLMMMGTPTRPAFQLGGDRVSVRRAADIREQVAGQQPRVSNSNANQLHNEGDDLEALACVAVVVASHDNGLKGVPARRFLACLASELQEEWRALAIDSRQWRALGIPDDVTVPYLFPDTLPRLLDGVDDVRVGEWTRPANDAMVDGFDSAGVMTLECKNRVHNLSIDLLLEIVKRASVYGNCAFHLVVCNRAAAWQENSDSRKKLQSQFPETSVWVAKVSGGQLGFDRRIAARGGHHRHPRRVIVFEMGE